MKVLPRVALMSTPAGRQVAVLSGAASLDIKVREPRGQWWADEVLTDDEHAAITAAVAESGKAVDLVLSHDAPLTAALEERLRHGIRFDGEAVAYADRERLRFTALLDELRSPLVVSGHMHFSLDTAEGRPNGYVMRNVILANVDDPVRRQSSWAVVDLGDAGEATARVTHY